MPRGGFHPVELRVQVLTLSAIGFSTEKISKSLNLSPRTVQSIVKKGRDRGYRPEIEQGMRNDQKFLLMKLPETAAMRKQADIEIEAMNRELEPLCREEWELATGLSRVHLRPNRGRVPKWNWNEKNDLNAIEPCWAWMKKRTTSRGAPRDKKTGEAE
ncbi:predicted protein [Aspergillus nidulans FGSC A4]|nr:predicted protein [Aspergillus nidulans FGSC A4]|eukprot:XP_663567.1 predicted protein [Aspergillus nidulans FGSC A4]